MIFLAGNGSTMTGEQNSSTEKPPSFALDGMLGGLAKWLRILGFDAAFPCGGPEPGRLFVTTRSGPPLAGVVRIGHARPRDQLLKVLEQTGACPDADAFLSRCLLCNVPVQEIEKSMVGGKVPDTVFQHFSHFTCCPQCGRMYWEGSHGPRIRKALRASGVVLAEQP